MSDKPVEQARHGLIAKFAGKAKEVAGAVLGNDSLAAEGQLQQAEAATLEDASTKDAVARAETRQAAEQLRRLQVEIAAEQQQALEKARIDADTGARLEETVRRTGRELSEAGRLEQQAAQHADRERERAAAAEQAAARARRQSS